MMITGKGFSLLIVAICLGAAVACGILLANRKISQDSVG